MRAEIALPPLHSQSMGIFSKAAQNAGIVLVFACLSGCGSETLENKSTASLNTLSDQQAATLAAKKVFFGHHSVGNDIIQGIRELASADPRLNLKIVKSPDPQAVAGAVFVEFEVGQNGDPLSKLNAFVAILNKGMGAQGGIAIFKFCYVDIESSTDVERLFDIYHDKMASLKKEYPGLKIVHVTVPLTTADSWVKAWIRRLLGRGNRQDQNVKRNQFNNLMRQAYAGTEPLVDIAEVESTHADGSRAYFSQNNERIYVLAPELTSDGGHLNEIGRRAVVVRLLANVSEL